MRAVAPTAKTPSLTVIPDKARIVSYMKSQKKTAIAPKFFRDPVTNEMVDELDWREDKDFGWSSETTYLFEKHNYPLSDEFINHVRQQLH